MAERWLGQARHVADFLALDLGHGIGMAIFLDGQALTGAGYKAGEIGHTVVLPWIACSRHDPRREHCAAVPLAAV